MTTSASASVLPPGLLAPAAGRSRRRPALRQAFLLGGVLFLVAFTWETTKWLAGDPWRIAFGGFTYTHTPPLAWRIASDISLPHLWTIAGTLFEPVPGGPPLWAFLTGAALYTLRTALVGFAAGALLGLGLGIVFVHSRFLERALVPWVVGSQTVPIIAIAPIVVVALGASWVSVAVVATYLTFFPVAIASIRGLRAYDARAGELMRSYGASTAQVLWKLRLPASVPYLFSALRVAAAASVIGTIVGELPSGIPEGLGRAVLNFTQYYVTSPERLWATVAACALSGLVFVGLVRFVEATLTRGRYRPAAG